jgi:hypothetical protein
MSEAGWLGAAGLAGAMLAAGLLEWLSPEIVVELLPEGPSRAIEKPVEPGLHQCELTRLTVEAETATYEARLAVLKLSIALTEPARPGKAPIPWPEKLMQIDWPGQVSREAGGWVSAIPSAFIHSIDCEEMPCLAVVSWEQGAHDVVDIGYLLADHVGKDVGVAAPFGQLVESLGGGRIAAVTVVGLYPVDLLVQWPARIDDRARGIIRAAEHTWARERPVAPSVPAEEHEGHEH